MTRKERAKRVLIVDDHSIIRDGLEKIIAYETNMEVCGKTGGVSKAHELIEQTDPDIAIIDLTLENGSGLELIKQIRALGRTVKILVSSAHDDALFAERAMSAGAQGYINKSEEIETLLEAIQCVLEGKVYLADWMKDRLLVAGVKQTKSPTCEAVENLTDRELEVLELIGAGVSTHQIADRLNLSVKTIETYRAHLKEKLHLESASELVRYAVEWALEKK